MGGGVRCLHKSSSAPASPTEASSDFKASPFSPIFPLRGAICFRKACSELVEIFVSAATHDGSIFFKLCNVEPCVEDESASAADFILDVASKKTHGPKHAILA